jgi:choice-of-anchor A domain-containing protein
MPLFRLLSLNRFLGSASGARRRKPARPALRAEALEDRTLLSAPSGPLGAASGFNVFILGQMAQSYTDAEGRVAVAGDASLTGYGVGDRLTNSAGGRDDLVVGGNLTYSQGQVFNGNVVTGGTAALTNVGLPNGTLRQGTPVDFAAAGAELTSLSAAWAALTPNGTLTNIYGNLILGGTDPTLDVFAVSTAQLAGATGLYLSAPAGASVLVNVTGTSGRMQSFGMTVSGADRQHVLFNFATATSLTLAGISVEGSVLAPGAEVTFSNGNLNGTLVARSLTGGGEFRDFPPQFQIAVTRPGGGQLSGTLFLDANKDGVRQPAEGGVAGGTLTLADRTGRTVASMTAGTDGSYAFGNLTPGTYTVSEAPPAGYGSSTPTSCTVTVPAGGSASEDFGITTGSLSGSVFVDGNNDGVRQPVEGGVAGVTVMLTGMDAGGHPVSRTTTTGSDGRYRFGGLLAGNYTLTEAPPTGYGDGKAAAGSAGGSPGADRVGAIALGGGADADGYTFGAVPLSSLTGFVYVDANNDGVKQSGEAGVSGVTVTLVGMDDRGQPVSLATTTSAAGAYSFTNLRPGTYVLGENPPSGYAAGKDTIGSQGGMVGAGKFTIALGPGVQGTNNNFGELGAPLAPGQTATIGFWQGPNGQALINSFGTTAGGQTLAGWLATTLPRLYGSGGMHDLSGRSNADVGALFRTLFAVKGQKTEAQVLATALAVFTTTNALDAGMTSRALAVKYGFQLSDAGTGAALWNVGSNNTAFAVPANTSVGVLQLLLQVNNGVAKGQLFGGNATLINQANVVFSGINQAGDIV